MTDPKHPDPSQRRPNFAARPFVALWARIQPSRRTRRALSVAAVIAALGSGAYLGSRVYSGQPWYVEAGIGAGVVLVAMFLMPPAISLAQLLWRMLRQTLGAVGLTAVLGLLLAVSLTSGAVRMAPLLAVAIAVPAFALGGIAVLTNGQAGAVRRAVGGLFAVVGLGLGGLTYWWMGTEKGDGDHLVAVREHQNPPTPLQTGDPSLNGTHVVDAMTYGSGTDRHRPEFGADVPEDLVTTSINGKPFGKWPSDGFSGWYGLKGKLREDYWGFDLDSLPRNGRVWMPQGEGPFPITLIVHGNHSMGHFSDTGYAYLGEMLASRGIIAVSVDENFLNGSGFASGIGKENDLRAVMLLEHLAQWREWNDSGGHRFYGKVDLDRVGLIGHSRGGEAVAIASVFNRLSRYPDDATVAFDYGFGIRGVASIAPVDGQYRPANHATAMRDVDYFVIHGGHDADVSSFYGDRLYRRLAFSEGSNNFKASLYVYRANHGQFNTVWGDTDAGPPFSYLLNRAALLDGEDQRQIAKVYLSAFFEASLQGRRAEYRPLFQDHWTGAEWLPKCTMVSRYEDASFELVAGFEEDVDVTTASVPGVTIEGSNLNRWSENDISLRNGNRRDDHGVFLGWSDDPEDQPKHMMPPELDVGTVEAVAGSEPAPVPAKMPSTAYTLSLTEESGIETDAASILVVHMTETDGPTKARDYEPDDDGESEDEGASNDGSDPSGNEGDDEDGDNDESEEDPPVDVVVELTSASGSVVALPLSQFGVLPAALAVRITRTDMTESRYKNEVEAVLQGFRIPLQAFVDADEIFDPTKIRSISFRFDGAPKGALLIDRIGFAR